jgi:hypothetical protein
MGLFPPDLMLLSISLEKLLQNSFNFRSTYLSHLLLFFCVFPV